MKKIIAGLILTALALPMSVNANELIFGVKAGVHKVDSSAFDPAPLVSAQISYEFLDLAVADIAVELEVGKSISDGEIDGGGIKEDFSVTTAGLYLSARTAGPIYAIGRIGVARTELDFDAGDNNDTGIAVGAGLGFSLGVRTEIELTSYDVDDEQAFYLSLGAAF